MKNHHLLKTVYYSIALCLFIWGSGWLLYEYAELYSYLNPLTYQNIMFVALGTALLSVILMNTSSQNSESSKSKQIVKDKPHTPSVSGSSKEELEAKVWNTKPGSKKRREILRQLEELEND